MGDGPPTEYGIFVDTHKLPAYVGNAPEVLVQLLERFDESMSSLPDNGLIQIGFPGDPSTSDLTYVGCWQWDIHSEARTPEFVRRAAHAIADAIELREKSA
ncbi:hypothetical protein BH11ACT7_BH11ACT7_26160 [soil metagenome]